MCSWDGKSLGNTTCPVKTNDVGGCGKLQKFPPVHATILSPLYVYIYNVILVQKNKE